MDFFHNVNSAEWLVGGAVVFMLAWAAFAFFGFIWLTARYGFPLLDSLYDRLARKLRAASYSSK